MGITSHLHRSFRKSGELRVLSACLLYSYLLLAEPEHFVNHNNANPNQDQRANQALGNIHLIDEQNTDGDGAEESPTLRTTCQILPRKINADRLERPPACPMVMNKDYR